MKEKICYIIGLISFYFISFHPFSNPMFACTTAVISGSNTSDGRPLLIKHRDSGFEHNRLVYFTDGDYDYIGLVNSVDSSNSEVWAGTNSAGFCIINSTADVVVSRTIV